MAFVRAADSFCAFITRRYRPAPLTRNPLESGSKKPNAVNASCSGAPLRPNPST